MKLHFIAALLFACSSIACTNALQVSQVPITAGNPKIVQPPTNTPSISWRDSAEKFNEHLSIVQEGWSFKQFYEWAGEPNVKDDNIWTYESPMENTAYAYIFLIKDGIIAKIMIVKGKKK
jgi:hypothetical protein